MTRILMAATLAVVMPALVLSQTQRKQMLLTERELVGLSRKAVVNGVGNEIIVADRFTGTATVQGKFDTVELVDAKPNINGDRAVVTGRVVFKGGLPEWHTSEKSSGVTIRFIRREGQWRFVGLCLGDCAFT